MVVKISGESLRGSHPLDRQRMSEVARTLASVYALGVDMSVIVGGGNLFRGTEADSWQMDRPQADVVGMIATGLNCAILEGLLTQLGVSTQTFSRGPCRGIGHEYLREDVCAALDRRRVVILAGGIGQTGVSTDVAAVHAAIDTHADAIVMSKYGVDEGVYDADPRRNPRARFLPKLTASQALAQGLAFMDAAGLAMARDYAKRIFVVPASDMANIRYLIEGKDIGSVVLPE
ncbi:hypothetical protein ABT297_29570 [Dactylosporangium sp. NPDC000555]|uniref:amino acid kinase family protein n=1 Tax=Dactylosporangium sp. NPDC000555 TaxID=3154260 RepID=UPI003316B78A